MDSYVPRFHRVYVVDDHDIVRRGLRDLLVTAKDIHVVGDSGSVREAIPEILRLDADVMLVDLHLQDGTGVDVCREVRAVRPSVSGLLLTASGDTEALSAAVLAGAAGYLVKLSRSTDIIGTIRRVRPLASLLEPSDTQRAVRRLRAIADGLTPPLSDDERRILELVLEGRTDGEIIESEASETDRPSAQPAALVARMAEAVLGRTARGAGAGRHRRPG